MKHKSKKWATSTGVDGCAAFVLGKSLVGGSVSGDIFEGIAKQHSFHAGSFAEPSRQDLSVELDGPGLSRRFGAPMDSRICHTRSRRRLRSSSRQAREFLYVRNRTGKQDRRSPSRRAPAGGRRKAASKFQWRETVAAARLEVNFAGDGGKWAEKLEAQEVTVRVESNGQTSASKLRVELARARCAITGSGFFRPSGFHGFPKAASGRHENH